MKQQHSLDMLIELSEHRRDEIAQRLAALNQSHTAAQQQLTMLHEYRQDYAQRLLEAGQNGVAMSNYMNFQRFIGTLDDAIQQQNTILGQLSEKISKEQSMWLEEKKRLHAYETLHARRHAEWQRTQARQEQRLNDEFSAALFQRLHPIH